MRNLPALVARWQKQNADAIEEMRDKHGVQILRTPPDILIEFLKAWDKHGGRRIGEEPVLQEGLRVAARVRRAGRADEAGLLPALLVRAPTTTGRRRSGDKVSAEGGRWQPRTRGPASREARPFRRRCHNRGSAMAELSPLCLAIIRADRQVHRVHRYVSAC